MAEVLRKFGKYFLLDRLGQGGMSEIYRARFATPGSAGRLLAIKKIMSGLGANSEALNLFHSEIKVTLAFNHPNIVQVYECGEEEHQPFIAMELIDGKNLQQFLSRFAELRQHIQPDLAAYIIEQAASALHYAHSFRDKITGEPLNVVHRDIKPQNILISYDGTVKVIDFGIAKASTNDESTRAGLIRGTINYLSPEQITGEPLDGRCDIFALGIVLWQLLTGERLFKGENDLAIMKQIESCNTVVKAPSTVNPAVPRELDFIVLKALAKQKEKRFQNAGELQRKLHKFLYEFNPDFNPADLSYHAKDLFQKEIVEDRKLILKLNDKAEQLLKKVPGKELTPELEPTVNLSTRRSTSSVQTPPPPTRGSIPPLGEATATVDQPAAMARPPVRSTRDIRTLPASPPEENLVAPPGRGSQVRAPSQNAPQQSIKDTSTRRAPSRSKAAPSSPKGGVSSIIRMIAISTAATIAIGFVGPSFGIKVPIVSEALYALLASPHAEIYIEGSDANAIVKLNGKVVAQGVPARIGKLPTGKELELVISSGEDRRHTQKLLLSSSQKERILLPWSDKDDRIPAQVQPQTTGDAQVQSLVDGFAPAIELHLKLHPPGGRTQVLVKSDSRTVQLNAEKPTLKVPLNTPLSIVASREGFKPYLEEFALTSGQTGQQTEIYKAVTLEPEAFGYLTLKSNPSATAQISVTQGNFRDSWSQETPIESERFPAGRYLILLENEIMGWSKEVRFDLQEGKNIILEEQLRPNGSPSP
jgi:serine/threonine protein kinase